MIPQVHSPQSYLPMYPPPHLAQPQINHLSVPPSQQYQSHMDHQTSSVPPITYNSPQYSTKTMTEFPQMDSGLAVPVFNQRDDPISCLNKAMAFLTDVASSRFPSTNNQLRTSSNQRNQSTIQDDKPKRQRNTAWFKEKAMLVEAQEFGQILDAEQLAFLADPSIPNSQTAQTTILNTAAFQIEDLDAYDSDCDDVSNAKVVLMANLSNYVIDLKDLTKYFSVNLALFLIQFEVVSICISNLVDGVLELMHVDFRDFSSDLESGIARR
ncbi:hypothetical protein Tco_0922913 [Tanacetum coccineum]|uniref:Uncharacterized protein n=1 Tax=Tanacetum coccineum TaxID=301880 RepID=A0ABQ5D0G8_9ASTR